MHKKLAADLTSLAHSILQMKNKEDVFALKAKAHDVYEKLALLAYVEEYINNTPNLTTNKGILIATIAQAEKNKIEKNAFIEEVEASITTQETTNLIIKEEEKVEDPSIIKESIIDEVPSEEVILAEKKLTEDIPFLIDEPVEEEKLISQPEISEQPFDELETILFGEDSFKEVATPISEESKPEPSLKEETHLTEEKVSEPILEEIKPTIIENTLFEETDNLIKKDNTEQEEIPQPILENKIVTEAEKDTLFTDEKISDPILEEIEPIEIKTSLTEEASNLVNEDITKQEEVPQPVLEEKTPSETEKSDSTKLTLEEELEGTISVDVMANLFEKAPVKKTLNDRLLSTSIKIDLNDRIAFVKNLFEGNQEDYNRVISQLNTIKTEKEAKQFILKMVKPDYDWSTKEAYEIRLLEIIERRFS